LARIWVLCGGPSTEFEVSLNSARVVCANIDLKAHNVRPVAVSRQERWIIGEDVIGPGEIPQKRVELFFERANAATKTSGVNVAKAIAQLLQERVDCVFIAIHGQFGEDGSLQGFLETAGVPYTGSRVAASALAFDKERSLQLFRCAGLTTPRGVIVHSAREADAAGNALSPPFFVKPVRGGSSVGITPVREPDHLADAISAALAVDGAALVEERVEGVEVSCGVVEVPDNGGFQPRVLPPTEIRPQGEYFDYESKYVAGKSREITPAELPEEVIGRIQECALTAHLTLGCEGVSRTDMIVRKDNNEPVVLETNTIPGLTATSLLPQQGAAVGIELPHLFETMIRHALWRAGR
jgi:D-alanine-D-alanine ligase